MSRNQIPNEEETKQKKQLEQLFDDDTVQEVKEDFMSKVKTRNMPKDRRLEAYYIPDGTCVWVGTLGRGERAIVETDKPTLYLGSKSRFMSYDELNQQVTRELEETVYVDA